MTNTVVGAILKTITVSVLPHAEPEALAPDFAAKYPGLVRLFQVTLALGSIAAVMALITLNGIRMWRRRS